MQARPWRLGAHGVIDSYNPHYRGEMAEWLKAHAWKACIPQGIQGSNPCLSATSQSNLNSTLPSCFAPLDTALPSSERCP